MNIALIDYGSGNLRSVTKSLEKTGAQMIRVEQGPLPSSIDAVVLPGVGSFGDTATQLRARNLFDPVKQWILDGNRFLGICLGYQMLFESSEESPGVKGFGIFPGHVRRFRGNHLKVPHIGWNQVHWSEQALKMYPNLATNQVADPYVYFVHSYYPVPADSSIIAATTDYGDKFAAAVLAENIFATQFHPEKSQEYGIQILAAFTGLQQDVT
jgi:imidazole glycerol-phosphate synthase subunit HisH